MLDSNPVSKAELELAGCLRRLFRHRYILRTKNVYWFQSILDHRGPVEKILKSFFLNLIVDETLGVMYLQESDPDIEERLSFRMGRKKTLSAQASLLLLQLRQERLKFYLNPEEQVTPTVQQEQLRDYLKEFDSNDVDARFEKLFQKSLKELKDLQVIVETQKNSEVLEITSICDLLLPADDLHSYKLRIEEYFSSSSQSELTEDDLTERAQND